MVAAVYKGVNRFFYLLSRRAYFQLFKYQSLHLWMVQTPHNSYFMVKILVTRLLQQGTTRKERRKMVATQIKRLVLEEAETDTSSPQPHESNNN